MTYTLLPSRLTAMADGFDPAATVAGAFGVSPPDALASNCETRPVAKSATYTLAPSGLTATACGAVPAATRAGVARVLLTHVPPWHDPADAVREARTTFDGPIDLASAGAVHEV